MSLAAEIDIPKEIQELKPSTVFWLCVRRHTIGWSVFFFVFFVLQGLTGFPVWQQLGLACALSVAYGYERTTREVGQDGGKVPLFTPRADKVWYFVILSAEWLGYLGVLVFLGQVFVDAVG